MSTESSQDKESLVTVTIDDREVSVPKGTNIIEAAKQLGITIPFYCYHPHLSVPGNCRMCQVEVEGAPKLMIGCHTQVAEGMVVRTHFSSEQVEEAQANTLEMILINHPLDCTVCDQAGHCKLQDYHYEYNARPSRFLEEKQKKPKAVPLGPTVMLDAERCIACTRCVRFCDEVTETGELGILNRGDRYFIAVNEDKELNNALSGTVVDLCPVGALTHRDWRFNTRIWYATPRDSICPGCSTGCNVKVFERDGEVVQVKARLNHEVNKEWLCDEGRYGYDRFLPKERVREITRDGEVVSEEEIANSYSALSGGKTLILLAPDLYVEEYAVMRNFAEVLDGSDVALAVRERSLTDVEKILVSPDYAPNYRGAHFTKVTGDGDGKRATMQGSYEEALRKIKGGEYDNVVFIGDRSLAESDLSDLALLEALSKLKFSLGILTDKDGALYSNCKVVLPGRSVLEKAGLFINTNDRLQYCEQIVQFPDGCHPEWRWVGRIAEKLGKSLVEARSDRDLTISYLRAEERLKGLTIKIIKGKDSESRGIDLQNYSAEGSGEDGGATREGDQWQS